ncbi:unnamed protein product [Urochloa humidicola]
MTTTACSMLSCYGGEVHTIDLNGTSPALTIPFSPDIDYIDISNIRYIVRAPWGDILQVLRQYGDLPATTNSFSSDDDDEYQSYNHEQCQQSNSMEQRENPFDDRESEEDEEEYRPGTRDKIKVCKVDLAQQKLTEIRDLQGYAIFVGFNSTFMINSGDFPNIRPNSVYISDDNVEYICFSPSKGRQMACLSLEDTTLTDMSFSDSLLHWPPPFWFRPHLS